MSSSGLPIMYSRVKSWFTCIVSLLYSGFSLMEVIQPYNCWLDMYWKVCNWHLYDCAVLMCTYWSCKVLVLWLGLNFAIIVHPFSLHPQAIPVHSIIGSCPSHSSQPSSQPSWASPALLYCPADSGFSEMLKNTKLSVMLGVWWDLKVCLKYLAYLKFSGFFTPSWLFIVWIVFLGISHFGFLQFCAGLIATGEEVLAVWECCDLC